MAGLIYVIAHSTEEPDRAETALHAALAAARNEHEVTLWLTGEGVRLGIHGVAETLPKTLSESAAAMMDALRDAGAHVLLERASFTRRRYDEDAVRAGAKVVDAGHLAGLLAAGHGAVSL